METDQIEYMIDYLFSIGWGDDYIHNINIPEFMNFIRILNMPPDIFNGVYDTLIILKQQYGLPPDYQILLFNVNTFIQQLAIYYHSTSFPSSNLAAAAAAFGFTPFT